MVSIVMKKNHSRLFLGYRIPEIAKKTNIPSVTIWRHATGARSISPKIAMAYSKALAVPLSIIRPDLWPPDSPAPVTTPIQPAPAKESA